PPHAFMPQSARPGDASVSAAPARGGSPAPAQCLFFRMIFAPDGVEIDVRRRDAQSHVVHRVGDDSRYGKVAKPFPVGRDHEPRGLCGARLLQYVFVRLTILRPPVALGVVRFADLPVALGILEPIAKAPALLLRADVQVELEDPCAVLGEQSLETVDE